LKSYFTDMLESNMDALVKRYITNGAMDKYGQIEGFFRHDMWPDGDLLVWQSDFVALVLGSIAERGNTQAVELLKWMDNFTSGRFIHGDDGFDPRFGAAYVLRVNAKGNGPVYTTWGDFFKASHGSSPVVPAQGIAGTPDSPYGYAANAKAAVAAIFSATQSPDAMEAFGFLAKSIVQVKGAQSFHYDPTWNIAPKLSDGSHLTFDSIRITSSSGNQTLTGSDKNELIHGSSGHDTISGGKGIDILFGSEGDDTLTGAQGDDFLYGGSGNDRLSGGVGNDYLKGNAGSDTFVFGTDAGGRDTIGDFRYGADLLEIKTDLNGNGLKTAAQVLGTATTNADGNAVLHLGGGIEIVLLGIHTTDLKADMIHMN
jgi:Ca2+-binding RTX toxin-like protein